MTEQSKIDLNHLNALLVEGMIAIRGLLEERQGSLEAQAALEIAKAMRNLQPRPVLSHVAIDDLERLRSRFPAVVEKWLPQTFGWLDAITVAAQDMSSSKTERDLVTDEQADLWAMSYGFADAREMKDWCGRMEKKRLTERVFNKEGRDHED